MIEKELRDKLKVEFVERFNFYAGLKGLTFTDIAENAGRTKAQISQFRVGRALPSVTMIHVLAKAMNIEPGCLFPSGQAKWIKERRADYVDSASQKVRSSLLTWRG